MVKLVQDETFRKLIKKNPAKAHALLTIAAQKGQKRVGEVLRVAKEWTPRPSVRKLVAMSGEPLEMIVIPLEFKIQLYELTIRRLETYARENRFPDMKTAVEDILLKWIRRYAGIEYIDLPAAVQGVIVSVLEMRYPQINVELLEKEKAAKAKKNERTEPVPKAAEVRA